MVLSDKTIKEYLDNGALIIDPLDPKDIQPASVDLHLDNKILVFRNSTEPFIDLKKDLPDLTEEHIIKKNQPFILHPGEFILASTIERIKIPTDIVARLEGKRGRYPRLAGCYDSKNYPGIGKIVWVEPEPRGFGR